jgi:hypothetical protein
LLSGFEDIPNIRYLDVEGEDGGLPLMEYCKSEGINIEEELLLTSEVRTLLTFS